MRNEIFEESLLSQRDFLIRETHKPAVVALVTLENPDHGGLMLASIRSLFTDLGYRTVYSEGAQIVVAEDVDSDHIRPIRSCLWLSKGMHGAALLREAEGEGWYEHFRGHWVCPTLTTITPFRNQSAKDVYLRNKRIELVETHHRQAQARKDARSLMAPQMDVLVDQWVGVLRPLYQGEGLESFVRSIVAFSQRHFADKGLSGSKAAEWLREDGEFYRYRFDHLKGSTLYLPSTDEAKLKIEKAVTYLSGQQVPEFNRLPWAEIKSSRKAQPVLDGALEAPLHWDVPLDATEHPALERALSDAGVISQGSTTVGPEDRMKLVQAIVLTVAQQLECFQCSAMIRWLDTALIESGQAVESAEDFADLVRSAHKQAVSQSKDAQVTAPA